jgi:hypothetical protein
MMLMILLGLTGVVFVSIISGGDSAGRGVLAIVVAMAVLIGAIGIIAMYHPPGDYRSHKQTSYGGRNT